MLVEHLLVGCGVVAVACHDAGTRCSDLQLQSPMETRRDEDDDDDRFDTRLIYSTLLYSTLLDSTLLYSTMGGNGCSEYIPPRRCLQASPPRQPGLRCGASPGEERYRLYPTDDSSSCWTLYSILYDDDDDSDSDDDDEGVDDVVVDDDDVDVEGDGDDDDDDDDDDECDADNDDDEYDEGDMVIMIMILAMMMLNRYGLSETSPVLTIGTHINYVELSI